MPSDLTRYATMQIDALVEGDCHSEIITAMMDINQRKARFSLACIEAVASHAGFQIVEPKVDYDSVDGFLVGDFGRRPRIEFQAKATARDVVRGQNIHFPLRLKNYNDLRIEVINPRILIVLVMPDSLNEWLTQTHDELCLRHCAYWLNLKGEPAVPYTDNVTVHIPTANVFSSDRLISMMNNTKRTGAL